MLKPRPCWVSERPKITPKAKWTPEEDKKLLELEKKCNGRWEKIPNEISHTPFQCELRFFELRQQMLEAKSNASQLVSEAQKEAEHSATENDFPQLGTVAAANSSAPEIDIATTISLKNTLESVFSSSLDDLATDTAIMKLGECEEKFRELRKEKDQLVKQKDLAIKEAHLRRAELGKVRDHVAFLEAAVVRAEEKQRIAEIEVEAKVVEQREAARLLEKQFMVAYICAFEANLQRTDNTQQQIETKEDFSKRHSADTGDARSLTKHVESSFENLDNPPSKRLKISSNLGEENHLRFSGGSQGYIHPTNDAQWNDNQATVKANH